VSNSHIRNRYLLVLDSALLAGGALLGYFLRFEDLAWLGRTGEPIWWFLALSVPVRIAIFLAGGLYRRLWRHASVGELEQIFLVGGVAALSSTFIGAFVLTATGLSAFRMPLSVLFIDALMSVAVPASARLLIRVRLVSRLRRLAAEKEAARVLIAGAGQTGQMIAKELLTNARLQMVPVGFLDDDPVKQRHVLASVRVLGPLAELGRWAGEVKADRVIIAMPSAPGTVVRGVLRDATALRIETRTVPSLAELLDGRAGARALREVRIEDLLRREPVRTDLQQVARLAAGQVVLVTGAGGSIGSELCRQLAQLGPARLLLLGHGENSIFEIYHELRDRFPALHVTPIIADVRDRARIHDVIAGARPHAIFHAAAHKHVPLMEENPVEAVTNNVAGTRNVVEAAAAAGTAHFVMISTDKAVRPTSIMGASKRVAEMVTQAVAIRTGLQYVSVRFGNVLGSRGSVVPVFLRQIRAGGPVKVTHPDMRRYFMTIPEAVQLVLQAGALGRGKEVFVLDMGDAVKVVDIATDLIRLSGLEVGTDIAIEFTGIRPGEKLYEEMFFSDENATRTEHPKVLRAKLPPLPDTGAPIEALIAAAEAGASEEEIRRRLTDLVPDFQPVDYERITPAEALAAIDAVPVGTNGAAAPAGHNGTATNGAAPSARPVPATASARPTASTTVAAAPQAGR
jgi:FlaA1/EpsC-like NDP-sugar epimerase